MIAKALEIASRVHAGQKDKGGTEYILHPIAVMQMAEQRAKLDTWTSAKLIEDVMITAILHDVLEDCKPNELLSIAASIKQEFSEDVWFALSCLTHDTGEPYEDYIERLSTNRVARIVKIADLTHNMDPRRLPADKITEKDFQRWEKYRKALVRLERH